MRLDTDRIAGLIVTTIRSALLDVVGRITALEQRQVRDGKDGLMGPMGPQGEKGADGAHGKDGAPGPEGPPGPPGPAGERGADGAPGRDGRDGQPGAAGATGEKGIDGKGGRDGINGKDGADGLHGKDGLGFDDIQVEHDGERGFTFKFVRGDQVRSFGAFTVPSMIHRGIWKTATDYAYQDVTTRDGSQWVCIDPTKKGTPGNGSPEQTGWLMVVKRGADGKVGPSGPAGPIGKMGPQGPRGQNGY